MVSTPAKEQELDFVRSDQFVSTEDQFSKIIISDDMFVDWQPPTLDQPQDEKRGTKGFPRLSHTKSKTGCQRCRTRRVKCDEAKPICGSCNRHRVVCLYGHSANFGDKHAIDCSKFSAQLSRRSVSSHRTDSGASSNSESKQRRLLEARLMHHWTLYTCLTFPLSADPATRDINTIAIVDMGFQSDAMLYSIYFLAALHIYHIEPESHRASENYQQYLNLAIVAHRADVHNLNQSNADIVCMTASMLRAGAFAALQHRETFEPYTTPSQWIWMNRGATAVHHAAWIWLGSNPNSVSHRAVVQKLPDLSNYELLFAPANRQHLLHLLPSPSSQPAESWTAEIGEAYSSTLSYIGAIQIALDIGEEGASEILRRCVGFPGAVPKLFFTLVEEKQPRALVILAYYFAYLARSKNEWWIGDAGIREVKGIASELSEEWRELMVWPLSEVERIYA